MGYCIKLSEIHFFNLRQICDNFLDPSSDTQNEIHALLRKFGVQFATTFQRAPLGVGKEGGGRPHEWHRSQKMVLNPHRSVRFPPPSVSLLWFRSGRLTRPDALFEASRNFLEGALFGTSSSPPTFSTPHVMAQKVAQRPYPKDSAVLKIPRRINSLSPYKFTLCGDHLWIFPRKTRCFRAPAVVFYYRRILFATTVVNYYDRSIFNMPGSLG